MVTWDGHMEWSHGMVTWVTWDVSHGMVKWDGSYRMITWDEPHGMVTCDDHMG